MTTTDLLNCARIARELRTRIIEPIFGPWHFEAESLTTELANAWQSLGRDDRNADSLPPFLLVHIADGEILKWSVELSRPTEIELSEFIESHNLTQAEWGVLLLLRDPDGRRFMPLSVGAFENSGRTTGAIPFREFESTRTIAVRMLERWIQRFEGLLTVAAAVKNVEIGTAAKTRPASEIVESDYAEPILKSELAVLFGVDRATIARRIQSGELRTMPGTLDTAKKVRIHGDDFPAGLKRTNDRKQKLSILPKRGKRQ
jgi:hypothetical protein